MGRKLGGWKIKEESRVFSVLLMAIESCESFYLFKKIYMIQ
jgi:hypothetical protein